jgi:hypothetical protein
LALGTIVIITTIWRSEKVLCYGGQDCEAKAKSDLAVRADRAVLFRFCPLGIGYIRDAKGTIPLKELLE